jgi:hypothetical protein
VQRSWPFERSTGWPRTSEIRHVGWKPGNGSNGTTVTLTTSPAPASNAISSGPVVSTRTCVSPHTIPDAAAAWVPVATTRAARSHEQRRKLIGVREFGSLRAADRRAKGEG